MCSLVHHVIITSDSEGPIYQVWGDRSMKCLGLVFFVLGYAWLAKVISKATWAPECHSFNKLNIHNAGECSHVIASSGAFRAYCVLILLFTNVGVHECVFACPERSPRCLFLTHDYFCPLPGAVSCFISQVTDREHFSSSTEQPGTVPGMRVGCSAQPWQTKGFVLLLPTARHHITHRRKVYL